MALVDDVLKALEKADGAGSTKNPEKHVSDNLVLQDDKVKTKTKSKTKPPAVLARSQVLEVLDSCSDDSDSVSCFVKNVESKTKSCTHNLVLVTQEGCPYCAEAKNTFGKYLKSGVITEVDVRSDRGKKIREGSGLNYTPEIVLVDCDDKVVMNMLNGSEDDDPRLDELIQEGEGEDDNEGEDKGEGESEVDTTLDS